MHVAGLLGQLQVSLSQHLEMYMERFHLLAKEDLLNPLTTALQHNR